MDLVAILATLGRRWYLTLPLLLLSAFGLALAVGSGPAGYKSDASVVVLSPTTLTPGGPPGGNPYGGLGGSQAVVAQLLAQQMASAQAGSQLRSSGVTGSWTVTDPTGGPSLSISVTSSTANQAESDANAVVEAAKSNLRSMQISGGATGKDLMYLGVVTAPTRGVPQWGHKVKVALAVGVVLAGLSCALVLGIDAVLDRRRGRRGRTTTRRPNVRREPPHNLEESA